MLDPEEAETRARELADRVREQAEASRAGSKLLGAQTSWTRARLGRSLTIGSPTGPNA